jgi:hypothetical protein
MAVIIPPVANHSCGQVRSADSGVKSTYCDFQIQVRMGSLMRRYDMSVCRDDIIVEEEQDLTSTMSRAAIPGDPGSTPLPLDDTNAFAKLGLKGPRRSVDVPVEGDDDLELPSGILLVEKSRHQRLH